MEALYCYSGSPAVVKGCAKRRIIDNLAILAGGMSANRKLFWNNVGSLGGSYPILLLRNHSCHVQIHCPQSLYLTFDHRLEIRP